jgi:hypothetical protein
MAADLNPPAALLYKLASIAVHADEYLSPDSHDFDRQVLAGLLADPEVKAWVAGMSASALAPRKRSQ